MIQTIKDDIGAYVFASVFIAIMAFMLYLVVGHAQAAERPFTTYETPSACVYVAGYGSTTSITVLPLIWKNQGGC